MCSTVLCYLKNPANEALTKVRVLLDSGAEVTMLERSSTRRIGLSGENTHLSIGVAGGGSVTKQLQEVAFQLVSMDQEYCSPPMVGFSSEAIAIPFRSVSFNPKHHDYLKDLALAE